MEEESSELSWPLRSDDEVNDDRRGGTVGDRISPLT